MKKRYWLTPLLLILLVLIGFWSFYPRSIAKSEETITLASSPGPYSELFLKEIKPILAKEGYRVENKPFTNLLNADIALNDGQVDLNVDQHTAYLNNFNKEKNGQLTALWKIPTVPMGLYPGQKQSLKAVSDGDTVAVPNDPSNTARAYRLLEKAGWIKLRSGINPVTATQNDIAENKYHLVFKEIDSATIPRVTTDFSYVILPGSVAYNAKVSSKTMLLAEKIQAEYYLVATTTKKNAHSQWAQAVRRAYQSAEFIHAVQKNNDDNYWVLPPTK